MCWKKILCQDGFCSSLISPELSVVIYVSVKKQLHLVVRKLFIPSALVGVSWDDKVLEGCAIGLSVRNVMPCVCRTMMEETCVPPAVQW